MNRANLMLLGAVILWGLTVVPLKWTLETMHPFTIMFVRLLLSGLLFLPFARKELRTRQGPSTDHGVWTIPWRRIALLSFTGVAGFFLLNTYGMSLTSGVNASIISATLPLFTLILAAFYLKERIALPRWIGLSLGICGVLLITQHPAGSQQQSWLGDLLVLGSQLIWAFYVIQLKRPKGEERLSSELFTALSFLLGSLMILPFGIGETWLLGFPAISVKSLLSFLFLVCCCTILAYWMWNKALESIEASKAGIYLNVIPLCNGCTSILLLNEQMTWKTLAGGLLILGGVLWAEKRNHPHAAVARRAD